MLILYYIYTVPLDPFYGSMMMRKRPILLLLLPELSALLPESPDNNGGNKIQCLHLNDATMLYSLSAILW